MIYCVPHQLQLHLLLLFEVRGRRALNQWRWRHLNPVATNTATAPPNLVTLLVFGIIEYVYSLWDSSEISLKHGPSSDQSFSVRNPYFLSKW